MEKLDFMFIVGLVVICSLIYWCGSNDDGIFPAPSGEAVYIAGEACTVNMGVNRPLYHIKQDMDFCLRQHADMFFEGDE